MVSTTDNKEKYEDTIYEGFYEKIYHPELKIKFLEENYSDNSTRRVILYIFVKSATVERSFGKDLCVFNSEEILDLARRMDYSSLNSLQVAFSYFTVYVDWCISNNLRGSHNEANDIEIFIQTQDLSQFISKIKIENMYLTEEELQDLVNSLVNYQDKFYIQAIYEGIGGEEMHEIRSLTINDIDMENNIAKLIALDSATREKIISDEFKNIAFFANEEKEYITNNGMESPSGRNFKPKKLANTKYILRPVHGVGMDYNDIMKLGTFHQKMVKIRRYIEYPFVSIQSIADSGMIHRIIHLTEKHGLTEPTSEIFHMIGHPNEYNLSINSIYKLMDKYKLAISLKNFH